MDLTLNIFKHGGHRVRCDKGSRSQMYHKNDGIISMKKWTGFKLSRCTKSDKSNTKNKEKPFMGNFECIKKQETQGLY